MMSSSCNSRAPALFEHLLFVCVYLFPWEWGICFLLSSVYVFIYLCRSHYVSSFLTMPAISLSPVSPKCRCPLSSLCGLTDIHCISPSLLSELLAKNLHLLCSSWGSPGWVLSTTLLALCLWTVFLLLSLTLAVQQWKYSGYEMLSPNSILWGLLKKWMFMGQSWPIGCTVLNT